MSVLSRNAWLVAFLVLLSGPASALAPEFYSNDRTYYEGDTWTVGVNVARKSCLMFNLYEGESQVLLGMDRSGGKVAFDFQFTNPSWKYDEGRTYEVITSFGGHPAWASDGIGVKLYSFSGIAVEGVKAEAVEEFAAAPSFNLKIDGHDYGDFSLEGVGTAFAKLRTCSKVVEEGYISLKEVARGDGVDFTTWPPRNPPLAPSPAPAPREDENERVDAPPGGSEDGPSGGKGKGAALGQEYYIADESYANDLRWFIFTNRARKSCFMTSGFEGDTRIDVGGDQRGGALTYYLVFSNESWAYEPRKDYGVTIALDEHSPWAGDGVGVRKGVAVEGVNGEVVDELAATQDLNLKIGDRDYGKFELKGVREGLAMMRQCIAGMEDGSSPQGEIAGASEVETSPPPPPPKTESHRGEETIGGARGDEGDRNEEPGKGKEPGKDGEPGKDREPAREPTYASGSGFFVDDAGYLLTNAHVVEGCGKAMLRLGKDHIEPALIVARETTHDLALLKMRAKSPAFAKFRGAPPIRLGESVVVFGYPLTDYLSKSGNLSTGLVASLAGAGDNEAELQISAPVQSGNSGGAVVDQSGKVVGVVVAKSNIQTIDKDDIEVIQNANFAIKADVAKAFLDDHFVAYETEAPGDDLKTPDVAEMVRAFSAQVICEVTE